MEIYYIYPWFLVYSLGIDVLLDYKMMYMIMHMMLWRIRQMDTYVY